MDVVAVDPDEPDVSTLARAAALLQQAQLVIYPTDTLYALGALALDAAAVERVRSAKGRPEDKPLPLVVADETQAQRVCAEWPEAAARLAARFWPGPLTLVVPARAEVPHAVTSASGTVAVRVPGRAVARRLCAAAGPLVATSANRTGEPAPLTCAEAVLAVGGSAALALDGGPGRPLASTIVDLTGAAARLLREGPVAWTDVLQVLG